MRSKRNTSLLVASLLGGLLILGVYHALRNPVRAAEGVSLTTNPRDVVINEVAWAGTVAYAADEWIELYNTTAATVSLVGWHLVDDDNLNITLSGSIPPHGYYLIERTDDDVVADVLADWCGSFGDGLVNTGEVLTLTDHLDNVIDTANTDGGGWPQGAGSPHYSSMERINPQAPDTDANWCTNDTVTRNGHDAGGNPINGTPKAANSCYQPPAGAIADLSVAKTGPVTATPGTLITYHVTLSNTGTGTATATLLTDTLPAAVDFVTQTSPFAFARCGPHLVWQLGDVSTGTLCLVTVTAQVTDTAIGALVNLVTATTIASETVAANNTAAWTTTVGEPQVLIAAVLYDAYQAGDLDEAVQLVNIGTAPADLTGWELCEETGSGLSCCAVPPAVLSPTARIWLARDAANFALSFGFPPDYEMDTWLAYGLSNGGDEVVLRSGLGDVVDTLVYKGGLTTTAGWSGPAVWPCSAGREEGQILYRIPDEATGLPVADTDAAADWIQYDGDTARGRRVLYPGWDLESLFWPLSATEPATVVIGITPDNGFDVVSQTIARARRAISVEVYALRHPDVITALVQKAQEGVAVTVLLEGRQAGVSTSDPRWQQELWACQEIEAAGGQCWFMIHQTGDRVFNRYDYLHAKFLVVDDEWALVTSQNLSASSMPSDDKDNGTYGSRGVVLATNAPSAVARVALVFDLDLDPTHHNDLLRWNTAYTDVYGPPLITYTPQLTVPDATTYTVHFSDPLTVSGALGFELFTAPEAALRQSDALLGLVGRAGEGDAIYVEQLYEHVDWGDNPADDPNPRLEAYVAAARRGATVRILLNGGTFNRSDFGNENSDTVAYVNQIARTEGLDLEATIGDPTQWGIHNKMVLVWLHDEGGYAHIGSINGSETSSKVNREMAIQVHSDEIYAYLKDMFDLDWRWCHPLYLPLVTRRYVPPADRLLVSEVYYWGSCEWVEIYNPTPFTVTLTGYGIGDAETEARYEGMYRFPARALGPGATVVIAGEAANCTAFVPDYEMSGNDPSVPNLTRDPSWGTGEFGLGNGGDEILLLDPANRPVDVVVYGSGSYAGVVPHPGADPGDTLERVPAYADTDDCVQDFRVGWSPGWVRLR